MKKLRDRQGFTIVEIMITMLVLFIVIAGAIGLFMNASGMYRNITIRNNVQNTSQTVFNTVKSNISSTTFIAIKKFTSTIEADAYISLKFPAEPEKYSYLFCDDTVIYQGGSKLYSAKDMGLTELKLRFGCSANNILTTFGALDAHGKTVNNDLTMSLFMKNIQMNACTVEGLASDGNCIVYRIEE